MPWSVHAPALVSLTALLAASLAGCASDPDFAPPPSPEAEQVVEYVEGEAGGIVVETVEVSARVVGLDRVERRVRLRGPNGHELDVRVGPDAVNFDQVELGDTVRMTLTEALVVSLGDPDAPAHDAEAAVVALAPEGAMPGGVVAEAKRVTGTVVALDPALQTATLRFEDGSVRTFAVRPDVDLSRHAVGEQVVFEMIESVALQVEHD